MIGTHLIWINDNTPVLYYLGWLSAICAPTYCMCSGYAHYRQGQKNGLTLHKRVNRCLKFMIYYWISCGVVAIVGVVFHSTEIPGNTIKLLANALLLSWSYTGIWWYAFVYIVYVLFSKSIFELVENTSIKIMIPGILIQFLAIEAADKLIPELLTECRILGYLWTHIYYLLGARLMCYIGGMYIAKFECITKMKEYLTRYTHPNIVVGVILAVISIAMIAIDKGILVVLYTFPVFIGFNCLKKQML